MSLFQHHPLTIMLLFQQIRLQRYTFLSNYANKKYTFLTFGAFLQRNHSFFLPIFFIHRKGLSNRLNTRNLLPRLAIYGRWLFRYYLPRYTNPAHSPPARSLYLLRPLQWYICYPQRNLLVSS